MDYEDDHQYERLPESYQEVIMQMQRYLLHAMVSIGGIILMSRDGTAKSLLSVLCRKLNRRRH